MAEEIVANGTGAGGDVEVEIPVKEADSDETLHQTVQKLTQKLAILEQEKQQLIGDKESAAERIKQLEDEILGFESDKRALSSIASRAAELETESSRLQHDLITAISDGQEANVELSEMKRVVEDLKASESEKSEKLAVIEKERNLLLERLNENTEKLKQEENRVHELEKKIEVFEIRENSEKSENSRVEEETKVKISEKDEQIESLNRKIDEFQSIIVKNRGDLEKLKKEKEELEIGKNDLEALLKKSERKVNEMEQKMDQISKELEGFEKINSVIKEKEMEDAKGMVVNGDEKKLKLDWPVVAVTAGAAIATVAVVYFRHTKN